MLKFILIKCDLSIWPNSSTAFLLIFSLCLFFAVKSETLTQARNYDSCEDPPASLAWSKLLEEYVVNANDHKTEQLGIYVAEFSASNLKNKKQKSMQETRQERQRLNFFQQLFAPDSNKVNPMYHQTQRISPPPPPPQTAMPLRPASRQPPPMRAITENELYLLGAVEKLVYRVDYLESRLRRAEQLIYYLMAGNKQKEEKPDACPVNFTQFGVNCYHINKDRKLNWKEANKACSDLNAHLIEFGNAAENEEITAYLLNQKLYRGIDYWLGALNPGLLWIWSNSGKPVNPNMNVTSLTLNKTNDTDSNLVQVINADKQNTSSNPTEDENYHEIKGNGRCLRFSYNPIKHIYEYFGTECALTLNYICEHEDKTLENKLKKLSRDLAFSSS